MVCGVVKYRGLGSLGSANGVRFERIVEEERTNEGRGASCRIRMNSEDEVRRIDDYSSIHTWGVHCTNQ